MCRLPAFHTAQLRRRPDAAMRSERRTGTSAPQQRRGAFLEVGA